MKITNYLLLSLFVFGLMSCSSDDDGNSDNGNPQEVTILGLWNASEMSINGTVVEQNITSSFNGMATEMTGNDITFNEDHTLSGNSAPFNMEVHYVIEGLPPFTQTQEMNSAMAHEGTWSREGNMLYIQENGSTDREGFTIETLNATTLKISGDQNSTSVGEDFPAGSTFNVTITYRR